MTVVSPVFGRSRLVEVVDMLDQRETVLFLKKEFGLAIVDGRTIASVPESLRVLVSREPSAPYSPFG